MSDSARASLVGPTPAAPAAAPPVPADRSSIHSVRDALGNRGFACFLQAKLTVGASDDPLEREADDVADGVLRMADDTVEAPSVSAPVIRRKSANGEQDDDDEPQTDVQMKPHAAARAAPRVAAGVASRIAGLRSGGSPLPTSARSYFEPRFGRDLGRVRTHTGTAADEPSRAIGAQAYTFGTNIAFRANAFSPDTREGRRLLAHELTHVVQQTGEPLKSIDPSLLSHPGEAAEREAGERAASVLRGGAAASRRAVPAGHHLPAGTPRSIAAQARHGRPLTDADYFESRFGTRFGHVRIHDDDRAASLTESADARAFTVGSHIFFNRDEYRPRTPEGRALIAHELAHVEQGHADRARVWRKPKGADPADAQKNKQEWERVQVEASGMDAAAPILAAALTPRDKTNLRYIGLHPKFVKVYDHAGKSLGKRIPLKETKGRVFHPGVYVQDPKGALHVLEVSREGKLRAESEPGLIGQEPFTDAEKTAIAAEVKKAKAEKREPKLPPPHSLVIDDVITEPERLQQMVSSVPNPLLVFFVPTYTGEGGKGGGETTALYASPIEGREDGQPANAPPWPVSVDGPKLVPVKTGPTYEGKVDWTANANYSLASQVISQVGESIHYKWELYDITQYAKEQIKKDPAGTKEAREAKPEKTLDQRIEEFKHSKEGTGTDVTGMGGANREFRREFEDWWKDTKRAAKGSVDPGGDTVAERLSNAAANRLSLELAPVSLLTTAIGAALRWLADLFAGPRKQQEVPMDSEGTFLVRVITTPAINEDLEGKPVIRPPSVAAKVTEVTPMDRAVRESLDEPGAQLAELQADIDLAEKKGNKARADYLRTLLTAAREQFEGSPLTLLIKKRDEKQKALDKFRKDSPTLSDYSRQREVDMLNDQIALYQFHEAKRTAGATGLAPLKRVNATLISEVTGGQYPLLISAGPMAKEGSQHQWLISDVTNREGDFFTGLGDTPSAAFRSALEKFGKKAAYGRGRIGVRTEGLGLEAGADTEMLVDSAPADWALAEKRIDDLVTTLALLGLIVASAGTAAAVVGAGVAAARLIQRWQAGKLYLDAQTVSDALAVLGGLGASLQLAGGLRVQKFEKVFAITQEGGATEAQLARAAEALKGAQELAKAVEIANEAINYGGLVWGEISYVDQMLAINEQERSGALTHAAARRARATATSSAVQTAALFLAANSMKAKGKAAKETIPAEEKPIPKETTPTEPPPKEKTTGVEEGGPTAPRQEPVPLSERRATPAELQAALPRDLQNVFRIDETLHGDTVKADYKLDPKTGLISEITLRCGPDARPESVRIHAETIRTMQKYQGFSGRVRQAISWVGDLIGFETLNPEKNPVSFEAALEVQKLPKLIDAQMLRMKNMEPNARDMAEAELEKLQVQLDKHLRTLDLGGGEAVGFIAAEGLSKAKQKKYAELLAELRTYEAGSDPHKKIRREMYELVGGDLPYPTWEKVYTANVERATKANVEVKAEHDRLGWGKTEQTVDVGKLGPRRLDIANVSGRRGVEVKAYETGKIYASEDIVWEVDRDAALVKRGWKITWIMIDTEVSGPLLDMLLSGGITVEFRTRKGGGESQFLSRRLPYTTSRPKATQ
jgi:hypothetical protein